MPITNITWVGEELKENNNLLNTDGVSFSQGVKVKFKTHFKGVLYSVKLRSLYILLGVMLYQ